MNFYDSHAWLSLVDTGRRAFVDAPEHGDAPVVGELWPNWNETDKSWVLKPYIAPIVLAPETIEDPCKWLLDVGPFFDRFGLSFYAVQNSSDTFVKAFIPNLLARHWVDLRRPDIIGGLMYMRGETVPGLGTITTPVPGITIELTNWILTTPAQGDENLVLRKLFFS